MILFVSSSEKNSLGNSSTRQGQVEEINAAISVYAKNNGSTVVQVILGKGELTFLQTYIVCYFKFEWFSSHIFLSEIWNWCKLCKS